MFATAHWGKHHLLKDTWLHRTARVSQKELIPCDLPTTVTVHWRYCPGEHSEVEHLTANGLIVDKRKDRLKLEPNGLLITDVQRSDAGWYICREGHGRHGRKRIVRLSIPCKCSTFPLSSRDVFAVVHLVVVLCILSIRWGLKWRF